MFDFNFCSRYIIEYILPAFFFFSFENNNEHCSRFDCSNWSSGTLYTCGINMYAHGWMRGLTVIPMV